MWTVLDLLRTDPEALRESQRRRGEEAGLVDKALQLDRLWRRRLVQLDELRHEHNVISRGIGKSRGAVKDQKIERARDLAVRIGEKEKQLAEIEDERNRHLFGIPNLVHPSVPSGTAEEDNVPIRLFGRPKVHKDNVSLFEKEAGGLPADHELIDYLPISHADYVEQTGLVDTERAAKVSGARFYYLLEDLVWLDQSLIMFSLDFLSKKDFVVVEPPAMMRRKHYQGVTSLEDFELQIYKLERDDLYLIATSEHPLAAMHADEVLEEEELPLKYAGLSPCYRREAGAHGRDTKGIFRVHQFNKVEQFVYCLPEESWRWQEELISNVEDMWRALELPCRVVNICTGELGPIASKRYDLEVWMPAQGKYREAVSCSNCLDYQSARLDIRYASVKGAPSKGFVHTLNSTALATSRVITAIIENNQLRDGQVEIPRILRRYLQLFENAPHEYLSPRTKH
ncbi:MAG: serine--tRNA ligase [Candidatus Geothermarchaeales archaeon]